MSNTSQRSVRTRSPIHLSDVQAQFLGPFITKVSGKDQDHFTCVVTSRRHRKRFQPLRVDLSNEGRQEQVPAKIWSRFWDPGSTSWWLGILFMIGSALFVLGAGLAIFPSLLTAWWHAPVVNNSIFFVGSIFFTSAGLIQYLEVINSEITELLDSEATPSRTRKRLRLFAWRPRNLGYLASVIQLIGTVLFNFNTGDALISNLSPAEENLVIWTPNMIGSLCFLISTACSYLETGHRYVFFRAEGFRLLDRAGQCLWIDRVPDLSGGELLRAGRNGALDSWFELGHVHRGTGISVRELPADTGTVRGGRRHGTLEKDRSPTMIMDDHAGSEDERDQSSQP